MFDLDTIVFPTDVSYRWIVDSLHGKNKRWDELNKKYDITSAVAEPISGAGFLSNVLRVKFFFSGKEQVFSAILKVPTMAQIGKFKEEEEFNAFEESLLCFHNQEIEFYTSFARHCDVIYFPKMYGYIKSDGSKRIHGRILAEDVGHLGVLPDVLKGLNLKMCEEVIKTLAKFHAFTCCFLTTDLILRMQQLNDKQCEYKVREYLFELDPFFEEHREEILQISEAHQWPVANAHFKFGVPPMMAHGDCWANNMFFEKNVDGSCGEKLFTLFDWQVSKIGTGLCDLSRFLATSASYEVIEEHLEHLLKLYYKTMEESMNKKGRKVPYDYEKCKAMFRYEFPNEFLFCALVLPLLVNKTDDEKIRKGVLRRMKAAFFYARDCAKEIGTL
ncbi:unnamed protein product [Bursaphelenchus xylophilus]|uniref:(pine wood nematode) hypothetical protein n=1 Tax=Bursaphelenchus xylophilus TaxID=6326 RepID=A0A1I7RUF0_BURXY|nr:unnamed protein product [Bursaphelenchus xylophilus]CAG9114080.1 unnamed protein product [Bursaphelenchus xylophilus]